MQLVLCGVVALWHIACVTAINIPLGDALNLKLTMQGIPVLTDAQVQRFWSERQGPPEKLTTEKDLEGLSAGPHSIVAFSRSEGLGSKIACRYVPVDARPQKCEVVFDELCDIGGNIQLGSRDPNGSFLLGSGDSRYWKNLRFVEKTDKFHFYKLSAVRNTVLWQRLQVDTRREVVVVCFKGDDRPRPSVESFLSQYGRSVEGRSDPIE